MRALRSKRLLRTGTEPLGHVYLEGDAGQGEGLEVSFGSFHWTQDESLFAGADVVLPVAVERPHTEAARAVEVVRLTALINRENCYGQWTMLETSPPLLELLSILGGSQPIGFWIFDHSCS